jgi:uncharacterized membrane protein
MFYPNLLTILSAFIVLAFIVILLAGISARKHKRLAAVSTAKLSRQPLFTAAMVLGIGTGGFIDGIVLHQLMQWHSMLSAKVPATDYTGKSINMFWDGIFHAFCLVVVFIGISLLWRVSRTPDADRSASLLVGGMLSGWAIFNLVEGITNHQLLRLHNVKEYAPGHDPANYVFLGISVLLLITGLWISRSKKNT